MIQDKQLEFSNAQAITASAASTNIVDLGPKQARGASVGTNGAGVPIHFNVGAGFTATGAGTLTIDIRTSDNADMSSSTTLMSSGPIGKASLGAGMEVPFYPVLPPNTKRYVDIYYTVGTGPMTAGTITARGTAGHQIGG